MRVCHCPAPIARKGKNQHNFKEDAAAHSSQHVARETQGLALIECRTKSHLEVAESTGARSSESSVQLIVYGRAM